MIRLLFEEIEEPRAPHPDEDMSLLDGDEEFWLRPDEHRCEMGDACCDSAYAFNPLARDDRAKNPAAIGIWLTGENDEPHWYTPWEARVDVNGVDNVLLICDECHEEWCRAAVKMMTMINECGDYVLIKPDSFRINVTLPELKDEPKNVQDVVKASFADIRSRRGFFEADDEHRVDIDVGVDESRVVRAQPDLPLEREGDLTDIEEFNSGDYMPSPLASLVERVRGWFR